MGKGKRGGRGGGGGGGRGGRGGQGGEQKAAQTPKADETNVPTGGTTLGGPADASPFKFDFSGVPSAAKDTETTPPPFKFDFSGAGKKSEDADADDKGQFQFDFSTLGSGPIGENVKDVKPAGGKGGKKKGGKKQKPAMPVEEDSDEEGGMPLNLNALKAQLAADPQMLAMMTKQLGNLIGTSSGYLESLPKSVQRRIGALKYYQQQYDDYNEKFQDELRQLEQKYEKLYEPLYKKRAAVVSGKHEPTEDEILLEDISDDEDDGKATVEELNDDETPKNKDAPDNVVGIPEFWLQCFAHHEEIGQMVTEQDEEALKYLADVVSTPVEDDDNSFVLEFHFDKNEFFDNRVIKKTYFLAENRAGVVFDHVECDEIKWKHGKNLCVRKVQKKKPGGRRGGKKKGAAKPMTVTVEEPCESFFNFFRVNEMAEAMEASAEDDLEEQLETLYESDYDIGVDIKENIIPNAVMYFTGEFEDDDMFAGMDDDEEDEEDDEDGFDDEDYDSEDDDDYQPGEEKVECKQQ